MTAKIGLSNRSKKNSSICVLYLCSVLLRLHWPLQLFQTYRIPWSLRKRGLHLPMDDKSWSRFRVVLTKEMQGENRNAFRPQSDQSTSSYQEMIMKGCRRKYKLNTEIHEAKLRSETRYKKKIKKKRTITLRLVFWISLTTDSAMCNEKRRGLRSSKNQCK